MADDSGRTAYLTLAMVGVFAASCALGLYHLMHPPKAPSLSTSGFDVDKVDAPPEAQPAAGSAQAAPQESWMPAQSPAPIALKGMAQAKGGPASGAGAKGGAPQPDANELKHQKEWLASHKGVLNRYYEKLGRITGKYYKTSPVVREVDAAFGRMPRYMEVRKRHEADGDPFAFAREAIALPEVRAEISKRMAQPQVWGVAIRMMLDTLRDPPPKDVYAEAKRFMTGDPGVTDYMPEAIGDVNKNMEAAIKGMPLDADMSPIFKVANDVAPQAMSGASPQAGSRR